MSNTATLIRTACNEGVKVHRWMMRALTWGALAEVFMIGGYESTRHSLQLVYLFLECAFGVLALFAVGMAVTSDESDGGETSPTPTSKTFFAVRGVEPIAAAN